MSRRTLLAGKALFTVGEAFVFSWATEGDPTPRPGDDLLRPLLPRLARSDLSSETDPDVKAAAKAALLEGEALAAEENTPPRSSVSRRCATAPREYKMCQRAGLDISLSLQGDEPAGSGTNSTKRPTTPRASCGGGERHAVAGMVHHRVPLRAKRVFPAKDDPVGAFTVKEGLFVLVPIWLGLLFTLCSTGCPDY